MEPLFLVVEFGYPPRSLDIGGAPNVSHELNERLPFSERSGSSHRLSSLSRVRRGPAVWTRKARGIFVHC